MGGAVAECVKVWQLLGGPPVAVEEVQYVLGLGEGGGGGGRADGNKRRGWVDPKDPHADGEGGGGPTTPLLIVIIISRGRPS